MNLTLKKIKKLRLEGHFINAIELIEEELISQQSNDSSFHIAVLNEKSACFCSIGNYDEAILIALEAIELLRNESGKEKLHSDALNILGRTYWEKGDFERSKLYLNNALNTARNTFYGFGIASALNTLGLVYWQEGDLEQAENHYLESLSLFEKENDQYERARPINNLAILYWQRGYFKEAEKYFLKSLEICEQLGNPQNIGKASSNLGVLYWLRGEVQKAEHRFLKGLDNFMRVGNSQDIARLLVDLAILYRHQNSLNKAQDYCNRGVILLKKINNHFELANGLHQYVVLLTEMNEIEKAKHESAFLKEIFDKSPIPEIEGRWFLAEGTIKLKEHDLNEALIFAEKSKCIVEAIPHFGMVIESTKLLLEVLLSLYLLNEQDDLIPKIEYNLNSLEEFTKQKKLFGTYVETLLLQGVFRRATYDYTEAIEILERATLLAKEQGIISVFEKAQFELNNIKSNFSSLNRMQTSQKKIEQMELQNVLSYIKQVKEYL